MYFDCLLGNLSHDKTKLIRTQAECNAIDTGKIDKRYEVRVRSISLTDVDVALSAWMWEASEYVVCFAVLSAVTDITRAVDIDTKCLQQESGLCPGQKPPKN
jgi:hypothetical protein